MLPDFKLYYEATVIKTVWYWHESRHIRQWYGIESPEISLYIYDQLSQECTMGEKIGSSMNGIGKTRPATCKTIKLDYYLTPHTKIKSK